MTHRDELAEHSLRKHVHRFDWSQMIRRYEAVLEDTLSDFQPDGG